MSVDILLSTYNGELYLHEQINSILVQTFTSWTLLIRDDGSTDNTRKIISDYCLKNPGKIIEIIDNRGNVGASLSFSFLLEQSKSEYIMFCDQDDVWLQDKVEITLNEILLLKDRNENIPLMVFTDLCVTNDNLDLLHDSFMEKQKLFPDVVNDIHKILALNVVAGCTIMINKAAKKVVFPFPKFIVHDHWMAVNIVYFGRCKYLDKITILYRQHGLNVYGAFKVNYKYFFRKIALIYKYISILYMFKLKLPFSVSILKILYYKTIISFKRL